MLVVGVCTPAFGAESVEDGDEVAHEVPVGSARGRLFLEVEAELASVLLRSGEEPSGARGALERRPCPSARELELRALEDRAQLVQGGIDSLAFGERRHADVEESLGSRGDDVLARPAGADADVNG